MISEAKGAPEDVDPHGRSSWDLRKIGDPQTLMAPKEACLSECCPPTPAFLSGPPTKELRRPPPKGHFEQARFARLYSSPSIALGNPKETTSRTSVFHFAHVCGH